MQVASFSASIREIEDMAAKVKKGIASAPKNKREYVFNGFVNVNLTAEQKEAYRAWDIVDDDVWDGIAQYAVADHKFSLSYNKQNESYNATATATADHPYNAGWAVSAYGSDPYNALRVLLYKLSAVLPDNWAEYQAENRDDFG